MSPPPPPGRAASAGDAEEKAEAAVAGPAGAAAGPAGAGSAGMPTLKERLAALGALYVSIATAVHIAIVLLAAELRPWLLEGRRSLWVRRALPLLLAGAAAWLAFSTSR